ncbi:hypothetical protein ASZ78_001030 [Callipepla squamata]|uniref:Ectopic P granules protein 5 homolog n=1 Tax=Callipepla squamata TaxID=9009 RepID=A0A226MSP2_CALSU|nr:hypothetical protein ASZ78_001030 [Callipepla squamata]
MAEAVRAPRRGRPKGKAKEKKKRTNEDSQPLESDDVFLPPVSEVSSQATEVQGEQAGEFTEIKLSDEAEHGRAVADACDISLSNLTSASKGSLTAAPEPSADGEESKGGPPHAPHTKNVEESEQSKLDKSAGLVEAVASASANSAVLGSSFHDSAAAPRAVVGIARGKEMENVQDAESPLVRFSEKLALSTSQPSEKSKMRVHHLGLKSVYPDLSTELSYERPTVMAVRPLMHNERLYPELPAEPELVPFTREQLKIFEPCSWLENVDSYTEEFESVAHQDRHEFYELLLNYMRCRKQLLLAEAELQAMTTDCQNIKGRLWTFKEEQKTVQGVCADQCKVTGHHRYQTVEMNGSVLGELKKLFEAKAEHVHQTLALHTYTSVLSRLQVESYVYRLLNSSSLLRSVALQQQEQVSKQSENLSSDLSHLKECISVLFSFTRRVIEDPQFQSDLLMWLQRLVRENRVDFMCHMKPNERKSSSSSGKESGNWTLVDEGGEEDEDPETSWILLLEDDLIVLLSQFPFHELFQHFLGFKSAGTYFPEKTTSQEMMKIFAFANSLVELLSVGLETFNRARYRQFVKRIGQLIKMTLCHVSDHWAQYISGNKQYGSMGHPYSVDKLQLEFDELFFRAVLHVLKAKRLGVWLFMSEMPYGTLSSNMLWKLFFVMHCAECENLEKLCSTLQPADCKRRLEDPQHLESFEKYLQSMNCSEEICLLTTFAQMAQSKRADVDEDFVKIIVLEIYEVRNTTGAFGRGWSLSTRETFSKVGRELLGAIASVHTQIISVLLDRVRETIEKVGMVSLYLFKELPLYLWKPSSSEITLIQDWLLNYSLTTVENKLACIILEGLNWGLGEQKDALHLDASVHSEVALMVLEAYLKYLSQKPYAGLLSESIKQVSYLASIVRYGETPESSFNQWAWGLILRLKLHRNDHGIQHGWPAVPVSDNVLDMTESIALHPLLKAVKAGIPIGCYLALAMTTLGHSIEKFCAEGIPLLGVLVQSRYLRTVVHVLDKVLPIFYSCQYYLLKNEQFLSHVQLFLHLDSGVPQGVTQQVTHKVTQHLTGVNYGENIKLLSSMIQSHIFRSGQPNGVGPTAVLEFWVQVLISQQLWHRDQATLYLLDHLCKAAFQYSQEDCVQKLLYQQHKEKKMFCVSLQNALGYHCDKGLLSSLVSWIVAGNVTPSFVEGSANSSQVWFSWMVLNIESIFEEDSQLRRVVEGELIVNDLSPDQALKKAQTQLKLPVVPSLQRLMIYRWAHQALVTPADHPLMPLIWQKFFLLYLHRPGPQYGLPVDGCIGRRFFQSAAHVNLLNEMKQRLTEVADFHHAASKALKVESPVRSSDKSPEKASCVPDYLTSPELHKELVRLCNVFILWLEEESFQKGDTYIPSLPKQYDAHRLAKIMQNQQELWMEYVNTELIHHEFQEAINLWTRAQLESHTPAAISAGPTDFTNPLSAKERIMNNLKKFDLPKPPLSLQPMKAPVPVISSASLVSQKEAIQLAHTDLKILQGHAKTAALWESQHVALNSEILDTIPKLYVNREEQITLHLECWGASNKGCQGAALVTIQFEGKHKNEAVSQQLHALRKEVKQLQVEATKPPSLGVVEAAVHVENFITTLINIYKVQPMPAIKKVGISLFFIVVEYVCDETQRNPPTRQFFTSCIEILGQVFISGTRSECRRLLQTILHNRRLCTLLSPYFTPVASPDEFVALYEKVVAFLSEDNSDVVFMLLTKFDLTQWLKITKPPLSERTKLLESIHLALNACGLEPEEDILMPFNIFCKHWTNLLQYQFPDHYSDFLRLFVQSEYLNWSLGCGSPVAEQGSFKKSHCTESPVLQDATEVLLSAEQVRETVEWFSTSFCKLRLASADFRTFGLFSKWSPYVPEVNTFLEYLIKRLIETEAVSLAQEPVGSNRILAALQSLYSVVAGLFKPWVLVVDKEDASNQPCYPWLESDTPVASSMVRLFTDCVKLLHESFKGDAHLCEGKCKKMSCNDKHLTPFQVLVPIWHNTQKYVIIMNDVSQQLAFKIGFSSVSMFPSISILFLIQLFPLDLDKLLPSHHGALWLHLMHYCGCCTAPRMPEFILYTFHTEFRRLPWKEMHPDQMLMEEFFKVERGSPKSCFLFLGYVLCEINWVSVLSDAWNPNPHPQTHNMIVCLLYMMVLLAKEEQLIGKEESPLINLLGQTSSLPWQLVGISSYQSIISYCSSHYSPSVILAKDAASELIVKLLKISAGFGTSSDSHIHLDATLKCQAYIRQVVQFLSTLEQNGKITLAVLEQEMSKLLDDVVIFNPPDMDLQTRHMALSSLFTETLMMMNNSSVTTAESLRVSLRKWIDSKVHGLLAMPLLTAACQSLASVRHMAETTEACITSYFHKGRSISSSAAYIVWSLDLPHHQDLGWGPILASLQVPELTMEEFLQECLSLGSYLTLYVYLLQCLNTDQTLTNEMKILVTISKWLEQVYPSSAKEEAKLFLWWHKAMQLSLIQLEQDDAILMESVVRTLLSIQGRQSQLAEERLTSGILGAIGLGRRSPLSPRFRLVARSLSAFLLVQIPAEGQVRLKAGSEPKLSQKAQQALSALESMASNKQYMDYQEQISQASLFIKHPEHCLRDGNNLLALLVNALYPEVHYLDCIR